jgi:hypothetical protein
MLMFRGLSSMVQAPSKETAYRHVRGFQMSLRYSRYDVESYWVCANQGAAGAAFAAQRLARRLREKSPLHFLLSLSPCPGGVSSPPTAPHDRVPAPARMSTARAAAASQHLMAAGPSEHASAPTDGLHPSCPGWAGLGWAGLVTNKKGALPQRRAGAGAALPHVTTLVRHGPASVRHGTAVLGRLSFTPFPPPNSRQKVRKLPRLALRTHCSNHFSCSLLHLSSPLNMHMPTLLLFRKPATQMCC